MILIAPVPPKISFVDLVFDIEIDCPQHIWIWNLSGSPNYLVRMCIHGRLCN